MIYLFSSGGKVFVWDASDVMKLRKEHRIVGSLSGIHPKRPFQIQTKWLPLQLMPEEACLLIDKGISLLVASPEGITDPKFFKHYYEERDRLCKEQIVLLKENRKKTIMEKADEIYEGKKRKFIENKLGKNKKITKPLLCDYEQDNAVDSIISESNSTDNKETAFNSNDGVDYTEFENSDCNSGIKNDEIVIEDSTSNLIELDDNGEEKQKPTTMLTSDVDLSKSNESTTGNSSTEIEFLDKKTVIEAELAKVSEVSKDVCMVQLFTECPSKNLLPIKEFKFPSSDQEKIRYAVFKDLWEKEYYITSGFKFGGDFLAYEGDPLKYHAAFIVVCIPPYMKFRGIDIITYGRLGHQVKKTVALASFNEDKEVEYISINWDPDM